MGIQLPAELAEVAAKAGLSWPQADEDAMRSSATAWREAGDQITRLASASDGSAGKALDALSGQTGDAARAHWNAIVSPDGDLGAAAKGCNAAADRLEHGADQVGAAKVELVRELVNLAKNNDAAHQAASAGHPTALLGLDTAVRGTSANVANLTNTLTNAVRLDSGVDMGSATPPVNANPGAHDAPPAPGAGHGGGGHGGGLLGGGLLGGVVDTVGAVVDTATAPVAAVVAPAVDDVVAPVVGTVTAPVAGVVEPVLGTVRDGLPGPAQDHGPDRGGPGPDHGQGPARDVIGIVDRTLEQQVAPAVQWPSETGSLPAGGPVTVGPVVDGVVAPAADVTTSASAATLLDRPMFPTEAPQAPTQQAPTTQAPAANVGSGQGFGGPPAAAAPGAVPPAAGGAAPAGSGGVVAGGSAQGGPQRGGEQAPQRAGQDQPAQKVEQKVDHKADQRGQQQAAVGKDALGKDPKKDESILPFAVVPIRVGGFGGDERLLAPGPIASVAPETPATPGVRPARTALPDDPATALFLLHMFPSRTLPAPSTEPAHQLPPPAADNDYAAGLRFEPQDHPDSALVEAGAEDRPLLVHGPGLGADHPKVLALSGGYDPQAGMHEREWDHRFLVRAEPPEYAWPPGELFPEGGYEEGQAGVLSEGVELDRFGTPEGRVLSELGTPFARRSLPPSLLAAGYHRYRVLRPLPVWLTLSAEWFGQAGSGVRYRTTYPVADLVALGYLMEISS